MNEIVIKEKEAFIVFTDPALSYALIKEFIMCKEEHTIYTDLKIMVCQS